MRSTIPRIHNNNADQWIWLVSAQGRHPLSTPDMATNNNNNNAWTVTFTSLRAADQEGEWTVNTHLNKCGQWMAEGRTQATDWLRDADDDDDADEGGLIECRHIILCVCVCACLSVRPPRWTRTWMGVGRRAGGPVKPTNMATAAGHKKWFRNEFPFPFPEDLLDSFNANIYMINLYVYILIFCIIPCDDGRDGGGGGCDGWFIRTDNKGCYRNLNKFHLHSPHSRARCVSQNLSCSHRAQNLSRMVSGLA